MDYDQVNFRLYNNGTNTQTNAQTRIPLTNNDPLYIGNELGTGGRQFSGTLAEIILFSSPVNAAQRIIINNALAAKYGFALAANDLYVQDNPGNGNYDFDVAGIGRTDASNVHNDAQGTGMIRILNPTNLGDDEFLIWGHNNGIARGTNFIDVSGIVEARFDRVWRVSEVNTAGTAVDVGNIDIRFDLNGLGPVRTSDLVLLTDTDDDGFFNDETPVGGALDLGGGIYEFQNVSGAAAGIVNNRRFTIGTSNANLTPLPVELLFFEAINIENSKVKLEWATVSEVNNDFFSVEKSKNTTDWEIVGTVKGAGNSGRLLNYHTVDKNPYRGVSYYRLKQTDFGGQYKYSQIKSVNLETPESGEVSIYPNPTYDFITVQGNPEELSSIRLMNVLGQEITNVSFIAQENESIRIIDLSNLTQGIYYLKTSTTTKSVYKR